MTDLHHRLEAALAATGPHGHVVVMTGTECLAQFAQTLYQDVTIALPTTRSGFVGSTVITDLPFIPVEVMDARRVIVLRYAPWVERENIDIEVLLKGVMYLRVITAVTEG